ncbi:MAG: ABC transporter ATP-binding protein [Acidobacteriota bacterium]
MIEVQQLIKRYGDLTAVDDLSFQVEEGAIYGLLGPNGAGKTTTLSMLAGLLQPDAGRILFDGTDIAADPLGYRAQLGVVPQETALYEELSATDNLRFWAGLYGLVGEAAKDATHRALELVGLAERADSAVKTYSGGMKRRLNLALGLVHSPRAVLLDEPTVGIDPQARQHILDVVREVANQGTLVLYTTHYLEEAERLCDRIGIVDHGRLLAEGTLQELEALVGEEETVELTGSFNRELLRLRLESLDGVRLVAEEEHRVLLATGGARGRAAELLQALADLQLDSLAIRPPSLNSLFLKLTGRELRDA